MPARPILSSYAGPMPRPVVPIARAPSRPSFALSDLVVRQQEVRAVRHPYAPLRVYPALLELVDLLEELRGIEDDAVPQQALLAGVKDARGNLVEDEATTSASSARTSTIFPFPSSPHWAPSTTTHVPGIAA
jgi:hypothetical protein